MSQQVSQAQKWAIASYQLQDSYTDFILSRQAILCTPATIRFYNFTAGKFIQWLENQGIQKPYEINNRLIYAYLAELASKNLADSYIHGHARAIRTFVRFLEKEDYIHISISFKMPTIGKKRLLVYNKEQIQQIYKACKDKRDKAFILLMVDSGFRQAEVIALNWGDVYLNSGIVRVERGKGRKARSVVIGVHTRRSLLKYKSEVDYQDNKPLFQTRSGERFTASGLRSWMLRVGERAGIHISPHALRRTFATLSLRAGMNVIQLQGLLGHSTLEMTRHYIEMLDEDLVKEAVPKGAVSLFIKIKKFNKIGG